MRAQERPFFEKVRVWQPEPEAGREAIYLELTNSGAILAFGSRLHDARWPGGYDHGFPWLHLQARSIDGGRSWELEERNWWEPETRAKRASVVDRMTGEIFLFNQGTWPLQDDQGQPMSEGWMIANYHKGPEVGARMIMEKSSDEGRTWDKVDLTEQFFTHPEGGLAWFIGGGIQLQHGPHAGRLIVPGLYRPKEFKEIDPEKHNILYYHPALGQVYDDGDGEVAQTLDETAHNMVIYSDDHGETWEWGGSSQGSVAEACIVELSNGSLYMNNRNHDPRSMGHRSWCISRDGGESFTEFGVDETLIESRCHAALARYSDPEGDEPGQVLFSNPAVFEGKHQLHTIELGREARKDLTVRVSHDDCKSWPVSRRLDEEASYSSLLVLGDGTILCASGSHVYRFNMAWLELGSS